MAKLTKLLNHKDENFINAYKRYYNDLNILDFNHWDRLFEDMEKESNLATLLLMEEESIIGFIQFQSITLKHWFFKEQAGFIRELWVDKAFRNNHYGVLMLNHALNVFKENNLHKVLLTTENTHDFFIKQGFKKANTYEALNKDDVLVYDI